MANEMVRDSISSTASSAPSNTSFLKLPESKSFSISNSSATSRSSRMDEEKDEFYKNLRSVREKIQKLGTVREVTNGGFLRLQQATDRYTELLSQRPNRDWSADDLVSITPSVSALNTSDGDLWEDEVVKTRLEAIQKKITRLEQNLDQSSRVFVDKMTSAYGRSVVSSSFLDVNSRLSEVEKGRSIFNEDQEQSRTSKDDRRSKSRGSSLPVSTASDVNALPKDWNPIPEYPLQKRDGLGSELPRIFDDNKAGDGRQTPRSISSSASSLRPLSDSQRSKLHRFQGELRREVTGKASVKEKSASYASNRLPSFEPAPQLRFECAVDDADQYCDRCGLSKNTRCVCAVVNERSQGMAVDRMTMGTVSSTAVPVERKATEARGTQTDANAYRKDTSNGDVGCQVSDGYLPAGSAGSSPARKVSRKSVAVEQRPAPFVTGKSTGPSHSVLVNWQQLLAVLKSQNPTLHEFCLRFSPNEQVSAEFLEMFQHEMNNLLQTWKDELKELSIDFSAAVQTTAIAGTKRKREIAKQANEIAAQMEAKDTAIQRIQRQLEAVVAAISAKHGRRLCKGSGTALSKPTEQRQRPRQPTSRSKISSASSKFNKAVVRRRQTVALMRDAKVLASVING